MLNTLLVDCGSSWYEVANAIVGGRLNLNKKFEFLAKIEPPRPATAI